MMPRANPQRIALAVAAAILAAVPWLIGNGFYINIATQILIAGVFALGLNVMAGYGGLVTLGPAALFGVGAYTTAVMMGAGCGHVAAIAGGLAMTVAASAVFAALSLRASGIGFIMITLALGQILWGLAYRWVSLTNGENGITLSARPAPFGLSLESPGAWYHTTLLVFLLTLACVTTFIGSPFGMSLIGSRDQPRRMAALGFHVWRIRFFACLFAGFWSGVAGILFLYYNLFISPHAMALPASAEALLMVIAGGAGTLLGPVVGAALVVAIKLLASAHIERWNFLLGGIFVLIMIFMPEGLVPGIARLARQARAARNVRSAASGAAP
jgi:branched-chain amino acid transport system permease protein